VNRIFSTLEHLPQSERPEVEADAMDTDTDLPAAAPAALAAAAASTGVADMSQFHQQTTQFKQAAKLHELQKRGAVSDALRARNQPFSEQEMTPLSISMADFELAIKRVQPSSKREGFATIPKVTWGTMKHRIGSDFVLRSIWADDVGALSVIRRELHMAVLEPIRSRHKYEAMGMHSPAGILLYGYDKAKCASFPLIRDCFAL